MAGSSFWRSVETIKFYLALLDHGIPVLLYEGAEIASMLLGNDKIGIVPDWIFPRYCSSMFPDEKIISFMNLPHEKRRHIENAAIWYPLKETRLV